MSGEYRLRTFHDIHTTNYLRLEMLQICEVATLISARSDQTSHTRQQFNTSSQRHTRQTLHHPTRTVCTEGPRPRRNKSNETGARGSGAHLARTHLAGDTVTITIKIRAIARISTAQWSSARVPCLGAVVEPYAHCQKPPPREGTGYSPHQAPES